MVHPIDEYVIKKVKDKRKECGMSQSQLAYSIDQSNGFIGKIESGKYGKKYNLFHLNEIAKVLKCSILDFLPQNPL